MGRSGVTQRFTLTNGPCTLQAKAEARGQTEDMMSAYKDKQPEAPAVVEPQKAPAAPATKPAAPAAKVRPCGVQSVYAHLRTLTYA